LNNGAIVKGETVRGMYQKKGKYTIAVSFTSADGTTIIKKKDLNIEKDDFSLFDNPL